MKKWNVTIEANTEGEAAKLVNLLKEAFELAEKVEEPLDHVYANTKGAMGKGTNGEIIICERQK